MNTLSHERKVMIVNALCQGMSLRSITRLLDVHRTTTMRLLLSTGRRCEQIQNEYMKNLDLEQLQLDEIWTFCSKKQGRVTKEEAANTSIGDQYLFYALDRNTKLIPAWELGKRNFDTTWTFIEKLHGTLNGCTPQISTDGFVPYQETIKTIFGTKCSYGVVYKEYEGVPTRRGRYAPPKVARIFKHVFIGNPDLEMMSTSHVERANLTLRTFQRRFTRLSIGFSRKLENLKAAVALHMAYMNFIWMPRTLKMTPAMAAGITSKPWDIDEFVEGC